MALLPRPAIRTTSEISAATISSMMYRRVGLSTMGSISLGMVFVAGRKRVPSPATGMTALRIFIGSMYDMWDGADKAHPKHGSRAGERRRPTCSPPEPGGQAGTDTHSALSRPASGTSLRLIVNVYHVSPGLLIDEQHP